MNEIQAIKSEMFKVAYENAVLKELVIRITNSGNKIVLLCNQSNLDDNESLKSAIHEWNEATKENK